MIVREGLAEEHRAEAAALFWEAFEGKLGRALGPRRKAVRWLTRAIAPRHAVSAVRDGELVGVAGFKTGNGGLVAGGFGSLLLTYGPGAFHRSLLLSRFDRPVEPGVVMVDGIFVREGSRGYGVGTRLLMALEQIARRHGAHALRLEVVEGNERARDLYERRGFREIGRRGRGLLTGVPARAVMELRLVE